MFLLFPCLLKYHNELESLRFYCLLIKQPLYQHCTWQHKPIGSWMFMQTQQSPGALSWIWAFLRVFALGQLIRFNLPGLGGPDELPERTVSNNLGNKLLAIQQILPVSDSKHPWLTINCLAYWQRCASGYKGDFYFITFPTWVIK